METELKYRFSDQSLVAELFSNQMVAKYIIPASKANYKMQSMYFDTFSGDLSQNRATLRVRQENDLFVVTIKMDSKIADALHQRFEWNVDLGKEFSLKEFAAGFNADIFSATLSAEKKSGNVLADLLRQINQKPLILICQADFNRLCYDLAYCDTVVEIALDQGFILGGSLREPICELELELKKGKVDDLISLGAILSQKLKLEPETKSKYARCLSLVRQSKEIVKPEMQNE